MSDLLSRLEYASLCIYHPRSPSAVAKKSRTVCYDMKADRRNMVRRMLAHFSVKHEAGRALLDEWFPEGTLLVPTPRSSPLVEGAHWPARRICEVLHEHGRGKSISTMLTRASSVAAAHRAEKGERPTAHTHFDSFELTPVLASPNHIVVVDDVLTKGATLIAAASKVAEAYPGATVRAFAPVRTEGLVDDIDHYQEPGHGIITMDEFGFVEREP